MKPSDHPDRIATPRFVARLRARFDAARDRLIAGRMLRAPESHRFEALKRQEERLGVLVDFLGDHAHAPTIERAAASLFRAQERAREGASQEACAWFAAARKDYRAMRALLGADPDWGSSSIGPETGHKPSSLLDSHQADG